MNAKYFEINEYGHNIRCKLYYRDLHAVKNVVIYGHGFGGHKDNKAAEHFAERITSKYKGYALITFNLPCHGDDVKRKLSLTDCITYFDLVIKYAKESLLADKLFAYSTSFGGYLTLKYIIENNNPFAKIALRCPAIHMYDVITSSLIKSDDWDKLNKGKDVSIGFDRKILVGPSFLDELKTSDITQYEFFDYADDILIIHGSKDEIVLPTDSKTFAENNVIEYLEIENADHRFQDPNKMELATQAITHFWGLS